MNTNNVYEHLNKHRGEPVSASDLAAELHEDTDEVVAALTQLHDEQKVIRWEGDPTTYAADPTYLPDA